MDTCFANMLEAWRDQVLPYCYWLRGAIDENREVAEADPELQF